MLLIKEQLTESALTSLFSGAALAVRIPSYFPGDLCERLGRRVLASIRADPASPRRIYLSNVRPFTEVAGDSTARASYLSTAAAAMERLRGLCAPFLSPADRLRCELDEAWPGGAKLLRFQGRPLVFGMVRVWETGAQARPHFDVIGELLTSTEEVGHLVDQLGVNVFLSTVDGEGAVEIWNRGLEDEDRRRHGVAGTYGYRRELLGEPSLVIRPQVGDLVLLRSSRLHAVAPTSTGERITLSGFVGYSSVADQLLLWS